MSSSDVETDSNYLTKQEILEKVSKLDVTTYIQSLWRDLCYGDSYYGIITGIDVFSYIFEPCLFDKYCQLRVYIFEQLGIIANPNINRDDMIDIYKAIKNQFIEKYMYVDFPDPPARIYSQISNFEDYMRLITSENKRSYLYIEGKNRRMRFFKRVKEYGYTLKHVLSFIKNKNTRCFQILAHSVVMFEELPDAIEKRRVERHELRKEIARVWIKKTNMNGWAVPTICAFAVPGSKKFNYMLGENVSVQ